MAKSDKPEPAKSDVEEVIGKIKVGAKLAAIGGLSAAIGATKAVNAGATAAKKAATKARNDLLR